MASVFDRPKGSGNWYFKYKDESGRWKTERSSARTKQEAKRIALEEELRAERRRRGLEPMPIKNGGGTIAELMQWYLDEFAARQASYANTKSAVTKHILPSWLGAMSLVDVAQQPQHLERFLHEKDGEMQPGTVNHLRKFLNTAFANAIRFGRWTGTNPVETTKKRQVPKRIGHVLAESEIPRVLAEVPDQHRALFATAIYTGLRRGELFGLRKNDIDLERRILYVRASHGRDLTKGGHQGAVPIADGLVPFLEQALAASKSEYVFPSADGERRSQHSKLEKVLRGALARVGIVDGYTHVCRVKGCGHREDAQDNGVRRCPVHDHKLWPKARARRVRFHDLRHTAATVLLTKGASLISVQRLLRHADPATTANTYSHVDNLVRQDVERMRFDGPAPSSRLAGRGAGSPLARTITSASNAANNNADAVATGEPAPPTRRAGRRVRGALGTTVVQRSEIASSGPSKRVRKCATSDVNSGRATQNSNLRPLASEANALSN